MARTVTNVPANRFELLRERLRYNAHKEGANPKSFGKLLLKAINDKVWKQVTDEKGLSFPSFDAFLHAAEPYGLGMDRPKLLHVAALAGITEEVKKALDLEEPLAERGEIGGGHSPVSRGYPVTSESQRGNSESYLRRRLARDHPAAYAKVVSGKLKAKEAARQVGIIKPTQTVPIDTPENALRPLVKKFGIPKLQKALDSLSKE